MKTKLIAYIQKEEMVVPEAVNASPRNKPIQFKSKKEPTIIKRAGLLCREAQKEILFIQLVLVAYEVN